MKWGLILDSNRAFSRLRPSDLASLSKLRHPDRQPSAEVPHLGYNPAESFAGGTSMRRVPIVALFAVCTCLNWAQSFSPQVQPFVKVNAPVVALTHVRVIAGTGEAALEDQTIIISKGKIHHVTNASAANVPSDA